MATIQQLQQKETDMLLNSYDLRVAIKRGVINKVYTPLLLLSVDDNPFPTIIDLDDLDQLIEFEKSLPQENPENIC